jgi:SAM-dependent methyltransferase
MAYHVLGQTHSAIECRECFATMDQRQGIWFALREDREQHFEKFIRDYETIRRAEGRGSDHPEFYLSLPYRDHTERHSWQWEIRARTYRYIERRILPALETNCRRALTVLDLGAGNGWLSYRLASLGHRPIAVDICTNAFDGLGAAVHYRHALPMLFPRFRAELDRLPFRSGQFDCAIFNASFHYSENYDLTLAEAVRCLRPGGTVVIADSPSYRREESGQQMLAERRSMFEQRFGIASKNLASGEYLTRERLRGLEARHDVEWKMHRVWYGFRWAGRPLVAAFRRRREPSQFRIYTAQVKTS